MKESWFSKKAFLRLIYSFPIQLVVVLFKKNQILLLYWLVLFGWVTNSMSETFGIPFLFLDPEYMGKVGVLSFFIMGITTGAFIMVYNISSYIINGYRFPFLATLSRPFLKYTINNFILPLLFLLVYCINLVNFQQETEYQSGWNVLLELSGFLSGVVLVILITLTYFFQTNKDIILMFGVAASDTDPNAPLAEHMDESHAKHPVHRKKKRYTQVKAWRVDTYLTSPLKIKLVRRTAHYSREMLESVFRQNHLNAAIIELIVFTLFIIMGLFKEFAVFKIPAAASVMLIFSMLIMLSSAFRFWLKAWATSVFILLFLFLNFLSGFGIFYSENKAYGVEYESGKADYNLDALKNMDNPEAVQADYDSTIAVLNAWRSKFSDSLPPKMVFINCSGGGLRASIWSYRVIQLSDSLTGNRFFESSQLISGASGGMMGASYYRELYLQKKQGNNINPQSFDHLKNIGQDLLNPITFSITVSDLFFNLQRFKVGNTNHTKDRAYAFEKQLSENTIHVLDGKRLSDYAAAERTAQIPMILLTPTIVNDGRRLLVSPLPIRYMMAHENDSAFNYYETIDAVEFRTLLKDQQADSVRFLTLLRMNATFPYILPAVTLPTEPAVKVMDAGIRDVTGLKSSLRFLHVFRDWIEKNTSGVIFVDIRDSHKERPIENNGSSSFLESVATPLGNIYKNLLTVQDFNQDETFEYAKSWLNVPFDHVLFELPTKEQEISLSFHLTTKERYLVKQSAGLPKNHESFERLTELLRNNNLR
ncbi:MAG: hypothetical protein RIQ47_1837 [Bacteroidota bacterium]